MLPEETDKVERFIRGLPDSIQGNVTSSKPTRLQEAIEIANSLMDQNIHNIARAYTAGPGEKKEYAGTLPLSLAAATNQRAPMANQRTLTCFECGKQGHYRSECPELKNWNHGNQAKSSEKHGRVYAFGGREAD
ncbi:reverse transcriptase domain-containing protein [Tanacetum coccineum]|uniref:Reverse transcriptase domain-containing protein n=1 Tax=Tanacetum coccineum TaxID=301880 RepID=A0ABQ5DF73_9ASTR